MAAPQHILCGDVPSLANGNTLQGPLYRVQENLGTSSAAEKQSGVVGPSTALRVSLTQVPLCSSTC